MQLDNLDVPRVNCVNIGGCNWGTLGHLHRGSRSEYRRPLAQPRTEWNCKDLRLTHAMEMQTTGVAVPSMTRISASLIGCKHRVPDTIWNACLGKKAAMVGQSMQRDQCTKAAQKLHKQPKRRQMPTGCCSLESKDELYNLVLIRWPRETKTQQ